MNSRTYILILSLLSSGVVSRSQPAPEADSGRPPVELDRFVVTTQLDRAREDLVPSLGATQFQFSHDQIAAQAQGANASFNQVLLRAPGVAQDSFGQLHLRGEHANLQYRINDVLLPEGISGFGQELDTRFIDTVSVLTGSLPAQYGYRTSGVVDIHTKSGGTSTGGEVSLYGGSFDTLKPAFDVSGANGNLDGYVTGSYFTSNLGIENPTNSRTPIHDRTRQYKGFGYFSYLIDQSSRLNLLLSASSAKFQIPNNPGQDPAFTLGSLSTFDSTQLNETQREDNGYAILAYQRSTADASIQVAAFSRTSSTKFNPDPVGDLIFNGVSSQVKRAILSNGLEVDTSWAAAETHTVRSGLVFVANRAKNDNTDTVFSTDADGNQISTTPITIVDNQDKRGLLYGLYAQDEWKVAQGFTVNYGVRADVSDAYTKEGQISPRINFVYTPVEGTNLHAGYARYFTPPPLELVRNEDLSKFAGTTNAPEVSTSSPVHSERSHYFDAGVTQKITPAFSMGLDGYYKTAKNQLDEGQFGSALIFSPFNYSKGKVYGVELSANYTNNGLSAYANVACSRATGRQFASGEFVFGQDEIDYVATHDVFLDHDQRYTASAGTSYKFGHSLVYADGLFGSGLRRGFANTEKLPSYTTANLGFEQSFPMQDHQQIRLRIDVVNVFDKIYELRDGSGIGVGAPQFGSRRAIYGSAAWAF